MIKLQRSFRILPICLLLCAIVTFLESASVAQSAEALSTDDWVRSKVEGCRTLQTHRTQSLERLRQALQTTALSTEERQFPDNEIRDYEKTLKKERLARLHDVQYLLFRSKKGSLERLFVNQASLDGRVSRKDRASLQRAVRVSLDETTPCLLNALGMTLLLVDFGLPLRQYWTDPALRPGRILEEVESEYARRGEAGKTPEETYIALRPQSRESGRQLIRAMLEGILNASPNAAALPGVEREQLASTVESALHLSAEPLRIEAFLQVVLGKFEGEIGIRSVESINDRLSRQLQEHLFPDVAALRALENAPPEENLRRAYLILDTWLGKEAWPALLSRLYNNGLSAYWLYVQTGLVVQRPFAFREATLRVHERTPELRQLNGLSLRETLAEIHKRKLKPSHVERYLAVERAMAETVLSRSDFLTRAARMKVALPDLQAIDDTLAALGRNDPVSSLDLASVFIRDASRFQIKRDRQPLVEGLRVFAEAKREVLQREIDALPDTPEHDSLAIYMHTAGEWMLELEQRQTTDKNLQLATGGGPIGWWLRRTVLARGLPFTLWSPDGVTGTAFARMVDHVAPGSNAVDLSSGDSGSKSLQFLDSGENYYTALLNLIDGAQDFLNIQQYDWKLDRGGKEIAYRIMAKKLGLTREQYESLPSEFHEGVALRAGAEKIPFYDVPTKWAKNLLFYKLFASSEVEPMHALRSRIEQATGEPIRCPDVAACGDLTKLYQKTGKHYDRKRESDVGYVDAWKTYSELQGVLEGGTPGFKETRPQPSLAAYLRDRSTVQRFIQRYGLKRVHRPDQSFDVNVITEGKRDTWNLILKTGKLQNPLLEFNVHYLPWKGAIEYPWHIGKVPWSGRWFAGVVPVPYVPWPWMQSVPALGWTGIELSMVGQHFLATDIRNGWGMVTHSKHIASESAALESGMGFGTKYFNVYPDFRTWHDTGVLARGHVVEASNEQFVEWFNLARRNNRGLPESRGVKIARLDAEAYGYQGSPDQPRSRTWMLSTDPDKKDYNYRGVFMAALAAARENIYIENSFYSDPLISRLLIMKAREFRARVNCDGLTEMVCATKRRNAVNIYLILPLATDQPMVDMAGRTDYYAMISEGVKIYLWHPAENYASKRMLHTKAWQIDYREGQPALSYVGSHNADRRSLWSDNEMGIASTSQEFAEAVHQRLFVHDMERDSALVSPTAFEMERRVRPKRMIGRLVRGLLAEVFWFF